MSFRKRNSVISSSGSSQAAQNKTDTIPIPGVRPSPLDGRPTTSSGTASLDNLLAGHSGIPLGTSLLIGEHGTTDFAGVLLRYYVAEGLVQGHQVHALGLHEGWRAELPGLSTDVKSSSKSEAPSGDKMKIAWRYESLGSAGAARDREAQRALGAPNASSATPFCHSFELTKRLSPGDVKGQIGFHQSMPMPVPGSQPTSPLKLFIRDLSSKLANSPPASVHRVIVPSLLSPTMYASSSSHPQEVLQFLHSLRALLRQYPKSLTAVLTLPLSLYPRTTGLTRWMELLCDGVLEFIPLQSTTIHKPPPSSKGGSSDDEKVQGLIKIHSLPIFHEKGGGSHSALDDQSFSLSRSKGLIIKPFALPPADSDESEPKADSKKPKNFDEPDHILNPPYPAQQYQDSVAADMKMTSISSPDRPLLRISKVAGRYLLFDIEDVMYLRRNHNICSAFVGTLPQNPEQNILMGLPLELMPEEAQVLVEKKVAYIADDATFHPTRLVSFDEASRRAYLRALKNQGKKLQMAAIENSNRNKPKIQQGQSKKNKNKGAKDSGSSPAKDIPVGDVEAEENTGLFDSVTVPRKPTNELPDEVEGYALTPTTSSFLLAPAAADSEAEPSVVVDVPNSYPLFAHLHDKGYFMMPGLRFGCDYNVYPGDPLRFHSHFAAVHFGWEEEITMMDLVGGGRLATSVKKGYLFGGAVIEGSSVEEPCNSDNVLQDDKEGQPKSCGEPVRAFCLEWAGM
ncbi:PAXNEB protein-domain-containing protein [Xylaria nigripes]|nr:PAXNEB protein-domain-containing protein [Xylaria nigripes]